MWKVTGTQNAPRKPPQLAPSDKAEDRRVLSGSLTPWSPAANRGRFVFFTSLKDECCRTPPGMVQSRTAGERWGVSWGCWDPLRGLDQAPVWEEGQANRGGEQGEEGEGKERGGVCV